MEVLDAVEPINQFLCNLHGPTDNIARTMGRLVPFPDSIDALADADVLDLSLSVTIDPTSQLYAEGIVRVAARYATSARMAQIEAFYLDQFDTFRGCDVQRSSTFAGSQVVLTATVPFTSYDPACCASEASYRVKITEGRGYRSVKITVRYDKFAFAETFARFAEWHNGDAPVSSRNRPTGIEISTFASGRRPSTVGLYSTHYFCNQTPRVTRRASVDDRISEMGWGYREPREGILFMDDVAFDAEIHITGDDHSSLVTFVGEFQLR